MKIWWAQVKICEEKVKMGLEKILVGPVPPWDYGHDAPVYTGYSLIIPLATWMVKFI